MKFSLCIEYRGMGYISTENSPLFQYIASPGCSRVIGFEPPAFLVQRQGRRSYIYGPTYEMKDELIQQNFTWDPTSKLWWIGNHAMAEKTAQSFCELYDRDRRKEDKILKMSIKPLIDISKANKRLTHSVYLYFILEHGVLYEITDCIGYNKFTTFYAVPGYAGLTRIEDPISWLLIN